MLDLIVSLAVATPSLGLIVREIRLHRRDKADLQLLRAVDRREGGTVAVEALIDLRRSERRVRSPQQLPPGPARSEPGGDES